MLTKTQQLERVRRKRRRLVGMFGIPTPKGTKPRQSVAVEPVYKPVPAPAIESDRFLSRIAASQMRFKGARRQKSWDMRKEMK